jgi:hypothetical protein
VRERPPSASTTPAGSRPIPGASSDETYPAILLFYQCDTQTPLDARVVEGEENSDLH